MLPIVISTCNTYFKEPNPCAWMLHLNDFVYITGRRCDPAHLWIAAEKNLTHPLPNAGQAKIYFARLMTFFNLFLIGG